MVERKIKRALISVYDKTGIVDFVRALVQEFGIEIISTGGTATHLKEGGIPVTLVEKVTGFPEMMNGRVKTLHPKIHAAILADRDNPEHMRQLAEQGIEPIDMVVVNLYPFEETVAHPDCTFEQAVEMIDIGGPCLLRAAAKNHKHVLVVSEPDSYEACLERLRTPHDASPDDLHKSNAFDAFCHTLAYDAQIASWLAPAEGDGLPDETVLELLNRGRLRYGENPHQSGELLGWFGHTSADADLPTSHLDTPTGQSVSFNNYADGHAALELCKELAKASTLCGTGFQPVHRPHRKTRFEPLEDERHPRRHLPHIQTPGKTYFVTFRLKAQGVLSPQERDIALEACRYWDGSKIDLHAAVVMPDHVHLLMTPREVAPGRWVPLGEIMHSIKRSSAKKINTLRRRSGALWQDESFDRIIRNAREYEETWNYIANNPIKTGLTEGDEYAWFWEPAQQRLAHRLKTGSTRKPSHRQDAGATAALGRTPDSMSRHRLQTGATLGPADREDGGATPCAVCTFIKHTNACGVGLDDDPVEAYRRAYLGDPNAAMGGILAGNFEVDAAFAKTVMDTYARWGKEAGAGGFFVEVWIAPTFHDDAVDTIRRAKPWGRRVRLLSVGDMRIAPSDEESEYRSITGGMLVQSRDLVGLDEERWKVVTKRAPSDAEMADLRLAWLVCKHTKSNAITICKDRMLIGNGAGQMSRVMSCRIATWLAKENGHADALAGSVAASDAFFPFPDGPGLLMDAGVTALIQPGGSKRDDDTIAACNERGVAMIFTGTRHFRH